MRVQWHSYFRLIDTATAESDAAIALVAAYVDRLGEIGVTTTPLDSRRATVRSQEAAIGNLIADAMRTAVDAEVVITNGGGIRADREYEAPAPQPPRCTLGASPALMGTPSR